MGLYPHTSYTFVVIFFVLLVCWWFAFGYTNNFLHTLLSLAGTVCAKMSTGRFGVRIWTVFGERLVGPYRFIIADLIAVAEMRK